MKIPGSILDYNTSIYFICSIGVILAQSQLHMYHKIKLISFLHTKSIGFDDVRDLTMRKLINWYTKFDTKDYCVIF